MWNPVLRFSEEENAFHAEITKDYAFTGPKKHIYSAASFSTMA